MKAPFLGTKDHPWGPCDVCNLAGFLTPSHSTVALCVSCFEAEQAGIVSDNVKHERLPKREYQVPYK